MQPISLVPDKWLGIEGIQLFSENDLRKVIKKHIAADDADVGLVKGIVEANFFDINDITVVKKANPLILKVLFRLNLNEMCQYFRILNILLRMNFY